MTRLSVVLPVYRVQGYLRQCLDSLLTQSFEDFEIVAVDDRSPDHSAAILAEYATLGCRKYGRPDDEVRGLPFRRMLWHLMRVMRHENRVPSGSRRRFFARMTEMHHHHRPRPASRRRAVSRGSGTASPRMPCCGSRGGPGRRTPGAEPDQAPGPTARRPPVLPFHLQFPARALRRVLVPRGGSRPYFRAMARARYLINNVN